MLQKLDMSGCNLTSFFVYSLPSSVPFLLVLRLGGVNVSGVDFEAWSRLIPKVTVSITPESWEEDAAVEQPRCAPIKCRQAGGIKTMNAVLYPASLCPVSLSLHFACKACCEMEGRSTIIHTLNARYTCRGLSHLRWMAWEDVPAAVRQLYLRRWPKLNLNAHLACSSGQARSCQCALPTDALPTDVLPGVALDWEEFSNVPASAWRLQKRRPCSQSAAKRAPLLA